MAIKLPMATACKYTNFGPLGRSWSLMTKHMTGSDCVRIVLGMLKSSSKLFSYRISREEAKRTDDHAV